MSHEAEIMAAFERFRDALMACDTRALDELMAPDYRSYNLRGHLEERDVVLEAYRPGGVSLDEWDLEDVRVEVFSEVGILTGRGHIAGRWQEEPWSHDLRFCDVWVRRQGSWQLLLSQATPMEDPAATADASEAAADPDGQRP